MVGEIRKASSMMAILIVCGLLVSCSAQQENSTRVSNESAATSPSLTTSSVQAPVVPARSVLPQGNDLRRNLSTVYTGCSPDGVLPVLASPGQVFDTTSGKNRDLPRPSFDPEVELLDLACTVTTSRDGSQRAAYLTHTRTPSDGLTPERIQMRLHSFAVDGSGPDAEREVPFESHHAWSLHPGEGTFIVYSTDLKQVYFVDPATLDFTVEFVKKERPITASHDWIAGINYYGYALIKSGSDGKRTAYFMDGVTGDEVGQFANWESMLTTDTGFIVETADEDGARFFDMRKNSISDPIAPYLAVDDINSVAEQEWRMTPDRAGTHSFGQYILLTGKRSDPGAFLSVVDLEAGRPVFTMTADQLRGLNITESFVGGNYLYLTNDSDSPVVDFLSGNVVSKGWSILPRAMLADGWVWVSTGSQRQNGSWEESSADLARAAGGGPYNGPWF